MNAPTPDRRTPRPFAPFLPRRLRWRCPAWLRIALVTAPLLAALGCAHTAAGAAGGTLWNLPVGTAGGCQLWADVAWDDGWRVQRHAWTGHARLLDARDVRRAWGDTAACVDRLEERRACGEAAPPRTRTVVLVHGLWRTRDSMGAFGRAFEAAGFDVVDFGYPSTRASIEEHASGLAALLDRLPGEGREVSFVTHSLGGLVVRALLAREGDAWTRRHRAHRAVLVAAPNGGAAMARLAARVPGALAVYGTPAKEIARGAAADLPALRIPFATIAAGRGDGEGWNPLVPGDDDGVVAVAEARLDGAAVERVVRGVHTTVMRDPEVVRAALVFVRGG